MAILDVNLGIYTALRDALETEFKSNADIAADCRIYWTGIGGTASPAKQLTSEEDYPQLTLRGATGGGGDLHSGDETFATYSDENLKHWLETSTWNYEIEIVSQGLGENEYTNLCAKAVNAVRKAGPRLGLAWVSRVRYTFVVNDPDAPAGGDTDEDGVRRVVSKINLAVQTQIDGDLLTGE